MRRQDVGIQVPRLEPKDLFEKRQRRDYSRLTAYNQLLEQIFHRIYAASQLSGSTSSILYTVPPFIFGLPKLDMEDCIVYLVFQLRTNAYEVRFTWPNLLNISWKHHESSYVTQQSPIIQAMTPTMPSQQKAALPRPTGGSQKKKSAAAAYAPPPSGGSAVSFNEAINIINSSSGEGGSAAAEHARFGGGAPAMRQFEASYGGLGGGGGIQAPARRAADYTPPASFMQQMERPERVPPPRNGVQHKQVSSSAGAGAAGAAGDVLADLWSM